MILIKSGIVITQINIPTIYPNQGFKNGLLPIKYPLPVKVRIQLNDPITVPKNTFLISTLVIPATTREKDLMIGRK